MLLKVATLLLGVGQASRSSPPQGAFLETKSSGWGPEETTQRSGYVSVNQADGNDGHIFYWLFESRKDPSTDPLVLWLTGGPGCSSELAIFYEQGPYRFTDGSDNVTINPYAWNSVANVLFVDQPVGTGFSYADNNDAYCADEECVGEDMWEFLSAFMQEFPQYRNKPFYVTGESYAGHYVPAISYTIYTKNQEETHGRINMKGFAIGNGLTNPSVQYIDYPQFSYDNGLISYSTYAQLMPTAYKCINDIKNGAMFTSVVCNGMLSTIQQEAGNFNVYDVRKPCVGQLCYDFSAIDKLMADDSVLSSLGVSSKANWQQCNMQVHSRFTGSDWWQNLEKHIPEMLDKGGYKMLVYSGKEDWICNWYGGRDWVGNMTWSGMSGYQHLDYQPWHVRETGEEGGEFKTMFNMTFLAVDLAGHMVPMDQPQNARSMLNSWINNMPFQ